MTQPNHIPIRRRFAQFVVRTGVGSLACLKVIGGEKVPRDGSFIIASNHIGRLDAALIYRFTHRPDVILFLAEKYRSSPILSWFANSLGLIFIDRYNADFGALREALNRLKKGGVMVLAPEGTRSPTASLQKARPGVSYLASKAGVTIFPVALTGSEDRYVYGCLKRLRRPNVTVRVGDPFILPPIAGKDRDAVLDQYTDEIMCRIAALLPPDYRGYYSDHPRLIELLAEKTS
jgi:1-acyl-sn-glycerol-3-phosphate acyltransferase